MTTFTIHELPETERPRERLLRHGPDAMSSAELIAIILGNGTRGSSVLHLAQELIIRFGSIRNLVDVTIEELCQVRGMGRAKAVQLKAALSLGLRAANHQHTQEKVRITSSRDAYQLIRMEMENAKCEHFVAILLDAKGCVINHKIISIGTISKALVHPREVFYQAIRHKASSMIIAHNHPSGDTTPSEEDIKATENLVVVGKVMGIPIYDHLIIGQGSYLSLREFGFKFN